MLINNSIYSSQTIFNSNRHEVSEDYHNNDHEINQLLESPPSLKNNVKLREAVAETATSNKEQEIADSLLGAIDDHTIQLEAISNWTEGGLSAFKGALEMMAQNMISNKPNQGEYGSYYEDLFQLVLMDVLANASEYNVANDVVFMQFLSWSLEYIGTGQHNSWVETLPDPEQCSPGNIPTANNNGGNRGNHLVKIADCVWYGISKGINEGTIPSNSLAARLMSFICKNDNEAVGSEQEGIKNISSHLPPCIYENLYTANQDCNQVVSANQGFYNPNQGGWITNDNNNMSPLMRLTALSYFLKDLEELSTSAVNTILYGDLEQINDLYKKLFNVTDQNLQMSESLTAPDIYHYIIRWNKGNPTSGTNDCNDPSLEHDDNGWQNCAANHNSENRPSGVNISLDFAGELNFEWLNDLAENYPKRILGDEDIKEINRLGDSVKMIMQTLKYWFQIMRDERVAIARNI
ncbi:molecular chaperone [Vibrio cholerae]|uniref:molecular chaperone n=1 Tax=Vibrio cholerae TaxID=666 RepID=UPI0011DBCECE|nr:molecular chaperone [Vibrio cholerae]EGR2498365.1 molecular chaperone [Vibrio cholerae]TXZ52900.1 molecular chaperone [Vibrio cholerae]GHW23605.1 molecular chaperone [Vibrio cholerae]